MSEQGRGRPDARVVSVTTRRVLGASALIVVMCQQGLASPHLPIEGSLQTLTTSDDKRRRSCGRTWSVDVSPGSQPADAAWR